MVMSLNLGQLIMILLSSWWHSANTAPQQPNIAPAQPLVRTYEFVVSRDIQVVGDRTLIVNTVNGKVETPVIHVRQGDTLSVLLVNHLPDHGMSLHWHGLTLENAKLFDGPVGVTQCAVAPGESFLYEFVVDQLLPGTYWWHAHSSPQPVGHDLIRGPFIIHSRDTDISELNQDTYQWEDETILFFKEQFLSYPMEDFRANMAGMSAASDRDIDGTRISIFPWHSGVLNGKAKPFLPVSNGNAKFRIINGGHENAYIFSIDGYELTVVAADGEPVEPYQTDALYLHVGERFDVTVNFNITSDTENVWVRARTLSEERETGILGILQIRRNDGVDLSKVWPKTQPLDRTKARLLNCVQVKETDNCMPITVLQPTRKRKVLETDVHTIDFLWSPPPYFAHMMSIDNRTWTQNILPQKALLMSTTTHDDLYNNTLILPLQLNKSVTFVIRSRTTFVHSIHIHGYKFEVLEVIRRTDKTCDDSMCDLVDKETAFSTSVEELSRRNRTGVLKDTVIVPAGGAVVIRLNTINAGVWLAHCHIALHLMDGFSLALDVGGYRESSFPDDFPSCDPTGRLQTFPTAECWCKEDEKIPERKRMRRDWRCSMPHLCRHTL